MTSSQPSPIKGEKSAASKSSRNAAEEAVGLLLHVQERQRSGKVADAEFVAMMKGVDLGHGAVLVPPSPLEMAIRQNPGMLKAAVCAAIGIVLYVVWLLVSPLWAGIPVKGKAWVNRSAAAGVELVFHAMPSMKKVGSVVVTKTGEFEIGLGRGSYRITASSTAKPALSAAVSAPESSPLSVVVDKPIRGLNLYLPDQAWKPRPAD